VSPDAACDHVLADGAVSTFALWRDAVPQTVPAKVKPVSPHHRFVIALHSPKALAKTGLRMCLLEKNQDSTFDAEQCVLCGPVYM
jgi:hypothetical protein